MGGGPGNRGESVLRGGIRGAADEAGAGDERDRRETEWE